MASPVDTYKEALAQMPLSVRNALLDSGAPGPAGIIDYLAYLRAKEREQQPFFWPGVLEGGTTVPATGDTTVDATGTVTGGVQGTMSNDALNVSVPATIENVMSAAQNALSVGLGGVGGAVGLVGRNAGKQDVTPPSVVAAQQAAQQAATIAAAVQAAQEASSLGLGVDGVSSASAAAAATAAAEAGQNGNTGVGVGEGSAGTSSDAKARGGLIHYAGGGFVDGPGGGLDDAVQAMIGGEKPAALSDGEYVLPSDVVSALGDGSSKAGAKRLAGIVSAIRQQKYGRDKQPPRTSRALLKAFGVA